MKVSTKLIEKLKENYDKELVDATVFDFESSWKELDRSIDQDSFNWFFDIYFTATMASLSTETAVGKLVNVITVNH